jgi:hypothetical protein
MTPSNHTAKAACEQTLAVVVRHAELLADAIQTAMKFRTAALAVSLYLLEPAVTDLEREDHPILGELKRLAAPCYCNHRPTAKKLGIPYTSVAGIASGLDAAQWVLTF